MSDRAPYNTPISEYPDSVQGEIFDIFRANIQEIMWAANSLNDNKIRHTDSDSCTRLIMNIAERIIKVFLKRHGFVEEAAAIAFQEKLKEAISFHDREYIRDRTLSRGLHELKWLVPDIYEALDKVLSTTPFNADTLHAYQASLLKVFDARNNKRRKTEPKMKFPAKPHGKLKDNSHGYQ